MYFLPIFIAIVITVNLKLAKRNKTSELFDSLIEEERLANSARKKEIPAELYVKANKDILPFSEYNKSEPNYAQLTRTMESAAKKVDLRMLKLPPDMKNNDIKFAFGIANFEHVVAMEENYNDCVRSLINWADGLIKAEMLNEAETVLTETLRLKSDFSKSYTLLCDIYVKAKNKKKLDELKHLADETSFMSHNSTVGTKIRKYISTSLAKLEEDL